MYMSTTDPSSTDRELAALLRRQALHRKYEKAVALYAGTDMPLKEIARECNVSAGGLGNYLSRYWRELMLRRYQIPVGEKHPQEVKIIGTGKQNVIAHAKYKDAIAACESLDYIELNVSQVANKFGVDGTALASFMRIHYPDIITWREKERCRLGINDNLQRGARPECTKQYAEAVALYRDTDMTIPDIAKLCNVSSGGLSQHLRFYHKDLLEVKRKQRKMAQARKDITLGGLMGNGQPHKPRKETEEKYAPALALYKDTTLSIKEIASQTGVPEQGFQAYVRKWHKGLTRKRPRKHKKNNKKAKVPKVTQRMKAAAAKYGKAIESLRNNPRPMGRVAAEFGLSPVIFRKYLHRHEPELANRQGMAQTGDGKRLSNRSREKYAEAIRLYETTTESLKSIAARLGLTYKSISGYVRRNYPGAASRHQSLLDAQRLNAPCYS